jgi:hypothetical protein
MECGDLSPLLIKYFGDLEELKGRYRGAGYPACARISPLRHSAEFAADWTVCGTIFCRRSKNAKTPGSGLASCYPWWVY